MVSFVRDKFRHTESEGVSDPLLWNPFYKLGQLYFHLSWDFTFTLHFCCFASQNSCNFWPELFKINSWSLISPFEDDHFHTGAQGVMITDFWVLWRVRTNKGGLLCLCDHGRGYVLPPHQKGKLLSADILCNLRARESCWIIATVWKFPYGASVIPSVIMSFAALGCLSQCW